MERVNQELEQYLRVFVNEHQDDWDELLPMAEFQYNNHVHSRTQQTSFYLDSSRHSCVAFEPAQPASPLETVNEFTDRMHSTLTEAKAALAKAQEDMTHYYNQRREPAPEYIPTRYTWMGVTFGPPDHPRSWHTISWVPMWWNVMSDLMPTISDYLIP
jgi:hypothetical protein